MAQLQPTQPPHPARRPRPPGQATLLLLGLVDSIGRARHTSFPLPLFLFYIAPVHLPFSLGVRCTVGLLGIVKGSCQRMGFLWCTFLHIVVFLVPLTVGVFFCISGRCFFTFGGSLYILLVAVLSTPALGACFRPGVRPTVSTVLTMGWTGRRVVTAISLADSCYLCT